MLVSATHPFALASFVVAAALLLLGMLNLAGLAGGRAVDRHRELTLRVALGGSTWSMVRLLATEHAVVLAAGTGFGLAAAPLLLAAATALLPPGLMLLRTPVIDARVVAFGFASAAFAIAIVTGWSVRSAFTEGIRTVLADAAGATPRMSATGPSMRVRGVRNS